MTKEKEKRPRRGRGEGSIFERKDGRWEAVITLENGKRRSFYGKTRKEAYDKKEKAQRELEQGKLIAGPKQTVEQFLEDWLENVHRPNIRESTYVIYRQFFDNHVFPTIGQTQLRKLTPQQVQALYSQKLKEGLASETVRAIHRLLHRAFKDAVRWHRMSENVCDREYVTPPRLVERDIQPLTKEQAQKLIEAAKGTRYEAILTLAVATGMRRGELLALRWQDVDFEGKHLSIRRTMNRIPKAKTRDGSGIVVSEPKTQRSKRRIMLPKFVLNALVRHRELMAEVKAKAGATWQENDLVFANKFGRFIEPQDLHRGFKRLLREAGLPDMRFHDLRHSAATILLSMGAHPKTVQELLGHSSIKMTMDRYSHTLPSMQRGMMDDLDTFFQKE